MKTVDQWLAEYGESHQHSTNKGLHWICVPVIVVSLTGLLWSLPVPSAVRAVSPWLNWGMLLLLAGVVYYLMMSWPLALGMMLLAALTAMTVRGLEALPWPLWLVCVVLLAAAWIGQFIGHHVEGKRPSFFKDVQFLMIGPLWLLCSVYRKLRIPYS